MTSSARSLQFQGELSVGHLSCLSVEKSALELDGWLAWNEETWGLKPLRVRYGGDGTNKASLEGVVYLTKGGAVCMPPRNPYLPFRFTPTPTTRTERINRQWLDVCSEFANDLASRGTSGILIFPPGLIDVRPFQWLGFDVSLRYTHILPFPVQEASIGDAVRRKIRKAGGLGLAVHPSDDWGVVAECLLETEQVKGFSHRTDARSLARLSRLVGSDAFRALVTSSAEGVALGALLRLDSPGGTTLAWSEGTRRHALPWGAVQLGIHEDLRDAAAAGATGYDFVGANMFAIARAKADWGAPLVPYVTVSEPTFGNLARYGIRVARRVYSRVENSVRGRSVESKADK